MSDSTPAPLRKAPPPATTVRVARSLWLTSAVVAAAAVVFAFLSRDQQLAPFAALIAEVQPDVGADDREPLAATIIIGSLAALAVVIVIELLLVRTMTTKGRGAARWGLLAIGVVNALLCVVASAYVTEGQYGALSAGLLVGQLVLAGAALVTGFLPSATGWFRSQDEARRGDGLVA